MRSPPTRTPDANHVTLEVLLDVAPPGTLKRRWRPFDRVCEARASGRSRVRPTASEESQSLCRLIKMRIRAEEEVTADSRFAVSLEGSHSWRFFLSFFPFPHLFLPSFPPLVFSDFLNPFSDIYWLLFSSEEKEIYTFVVVLL